MPKKVKSSSLNCESCPLFKDKEQNFAKANGMFIALDGSQVADVMMVEESAEERAALLELITPDEQHSLYITRAVKCWGGASAEVPLQAIKCCHEMYMKKELKAFLGEKIILFGNLAVHVALRQKVKLQEVIGLPFRLEGMKAWMLAVWRPLQSECYMNTQHLVDIMRSIKWAFGGNIK